MSDEKIENVKLRKKQFSDYTNSYIRKYFVFRKV
jgi:hypothetical protein